MSYGFHSGRQSRSRRQPKYSDDIVDALNRALSAGQARGGRDRHGLPQALQQRMPVNLSNGEYQFAPEDVYAIGLNALASLRQGKRAGFYEGGEVGGENKQPLARNNESSVENVKVSNGDKENEPIWKNILIGLSKSGDRITNGYAGRSGEGLGQGINAVLDEIESKPEVNGTNDNSSVRENNKFSTFAEKLGRYGHAFKKGYEKGIEEETPWEKDKTPGKSGNPFTREDLYSLVDAPEDIMSAEVKLPLSAADAAIQTRKDYNSGFINESAKENSNSFTQKIMDSMGKFRYANDEELFRDQQAGNLVPIESPVALMHLIKDPKGRALIESAIENTARNFNALIPEIWQGVKGLTNGEDFTSAMHNPTARDKFYAEHGGKEAANAQYADQIYKFIHLGSLLKNKELMKNIPWSKIARHSVIDGVSDASESKDTSDFLKKFAGDVGFNIVDNSLHGVPKAIKNDINYFKNSRSNSQPINERETQPDASNLIDKNRNIFNPMNGIFARTPDAVTNINGAYNSDSSHGNKMNRNFHSDHHFTDTGNAALRRLENGPQGDLDALQEKIRREIGRNDVYVRRDKNNRISVGDNTSALY